MTENYTDGGPVSQMRIRDLVAMNCLAAMLSNPGTLDTTLQTGDNTVPEHFALTAFEAADAFLRIRDRQEEERNK